MTLREIGEGIRSWVETTATTMETKDLVDWPVGVALVTVVLCGVGILIALSMAGGFFRFFFGVIREGTNAAKRADQYRSGIPTDPVERLEWANRTGRYAPGADKGE